LKRGHREDGERDRERGLDEIFSDEDADGDRDDELSRHPLRHDHRNDEFADFIEEDELDDEEDRLKDQEEREVARPRDRVYTAAGGFEVAGLDKDALEDMEAVFGNGEDYDWALALEEEAEIRETGDGQLELKDVFEPAQLAEKLLTDEDNHIRYTDEPERFQLDRKPYKHIQITDEQFKEEAHWISAFMWPRKAAQLSHDLHAPFQRAISKVLEFFVVDVVEVPYVFQHRKDYLIHARKTKLAPDPENPDQPDYYVSAEKLLNQDDLWRILELDLKFRALIEKRNALEKTFDNIKSIAGVDDEAFAELLPAAQTMEELQDLQDYLHFTYNSHIKDILAAEAEARDRQKRPGGQSSVFDRVRRGKAYNLVKAYGITADQIASNVMKEGRKTYTEDPPTRPIDLADTLTSDSEFRTGEQALLAARQMFAEEMYISPRMRKHFRANYFGSTAMISCHRTEKGLRRIDEQHQYYELKYLKNVEIRDCVERPDMLLRMLKAEEEGLIEVKITLQNEKEFKRQILQEFTSDNYSEVADAWNDERLKVLDMAFSKLEKYSIKSVKENLKIECELEVLKICREKYSAKLDQAPYKPKGMVLGTIPRVLALSNGDGDLNRSPVHWAWVEEDGRVLEHGKFINLARDEQQREAFVSLVMRRRPDVIGVSGFSVETHRLLKDIKDLVQEKDLRGAEFDDPETDEPRSEPLDVIVVNDEVARLYKDSPRAFHDHPSLPSLTRYCVALAKYIQNPLKEYASLGNDIISLSFHPCQYLVPVEKLRKQLDTAMVDMVNLCGVDINDAVNDPYTANLLPYVCGLGPRKATAVIKAINVNGGVVNTREELVGDPDSGKLPVVGPLVWNNCASFLSIEYDPSAPNSDYLDNTRVHPEDYELGRKMAADALELDEEDVKAEVDEGGPGAVVRKLIKDDEQEKVNDLILEEYAEQLEQNFNQRKRATLETIRAELQQPYEELRRNFAALTDDEIFTILTGETSETLDEGMIVSINIRVVKDDFIIVKLDSGLEGKVDSYDVDESTRKYSSGQTAQGRIISLDKRDFSCKLSLREDQLKKPYRRQFNHRYDQWDTVQESKDREELKEKDKVTGRTQRVINHPLFRPFNSVQAEEYLGSQAAGDAVIRPSSKGNDHLAVTWKVADGVYQHIDVLELKKESEFAVGKLLMVAGKYQYSDLDELVVIHIKGMAKKVNEMMQHEKYQAGSKADLGKHYFCVRCLLCQR
jgi:transcription elongation factor SPT6